MGIVSFFKYLFAKKEIYTLEDVFTPTRAAKLNYVKRAELEQLINRSIRIPGTQIILYGHSGGGKTTLVRNILESQNRQYIVTNCVTGTTVDELIINAFDKLNPYYKSEVATKETSKITGSLKSSYISIEAGLASEVASEVSEKKVRALPIQLTFERLGQFLGAANCVWIIEDFHKVDEADKQKLSDIMKAFVDIANDYDKVKIVAIGAVSTAREVVNYSPDINSRVAEINVPLLTDDEIRQVIVNGTKLLNVSFPDILTERTITYSNSLGSLCHQLCYSHCEQMGVEKTASKSFLIPANILNKTIEQYVSQKSDTFQQKLDRALRQRKARFENVRLILNAFIHHSKETLTFNELLTKIRDWEPEYPSGNLTNYLKPLTTSNFDEIIRYDENSGRYSFSDPFFRAFCAMALEKMDNEDKEFHFSIKSVIDKLDWLIIEE